MKIQSKSPELAEADMTPMIDIVFQLIAFFMVITNFDQAQADERVKLPNDQLAKPPEVAPEHQLVLNIGFIRKNEEIVSGPYVFIQGQQFAIEGFGPSLKAEAAVFRDKGAKLGDVSVVLRSDGEVPTGLVQELIKLSQEAGFEKFNFAAKQED